MSWKLRRSTVVLVAVFVATLALFVAVRPEPGTSVRYVPAVPAPTTARPRRATTSVAPATPEPGATTTTSPS